MLIQNEDQEVQVYLGSNDGKFTPLGDVFYLDDVNSEQVEIYDFLITFRYLILDK